MTDFTEVPLDELFDFKSGLSKPKSDFGFGKGFLSFKEVFNNYFVPEILTNLANTSATEQNACSIKRGDVFLTRTSETIDELGMSCVALKDYEHATFNGFTKRLRPKNPSTIHPEYAAFFFRSPRFRREITALSSLSTRASLNNDMLSRLKMVLPDIQTQRRIGTILKAFTDKIDLNRRMNETLEAMARALFKSWFVDFDPVKAKMEGRQPAGMDAETAALFPDRLVESELGMIPEGWSVKTLGIACSHLKRGLQPKYVDSGGVLVINQKCIRNQWIDYGLARRHDPQARKIQGRELEIGDVVINSTGVGTLGRTAQIQYLAETTIADTHVTVLRPDEHHVKKDYFGLWAIHNESKFETMGHGSTGQTELSREALASLPIISPLLNIQDCFRFTVESLRRKRLQASQESKTLEYTRSTLLPKLISGEISVAEAEERVADA